MDASRRRNRRTGQPKACNVLTRKSFVTITQIRNSSIVCYIGTTVSLCVTGKR
jgi:hypothetical protein